MTDILSRLNAALEGRYRIERQLGEGGMATVYLADDVRHDRRVALKVLKPELAAVVGADRFLAEIRTTANLQHPHILPLFDSGEADSFLYYVMPYIEGETLRGRLDRDKQLPVDEAVRIASAVAGALEVAHEAGVVHRDIKPANILVSRGQPLVADFGIALAVGAAGGNRLTETGLSVGTPFYMSPEQATGDRQVGPASDVYALGCVLYEMLVGDPPFTGSTAQAVLGKIISGEPVSPAKERPSIPGNVDAAVRRALERLPADRFTSAAEFARALGDPTFRHGDLAAARESGSDIWKPVAGVASVIAVAAVAVALWLAGRDTNEIRDVGLPHEAPMQVGRTTPAMAVAPDASFMVYEAKMGSTSELWYRSLTGQEARPLRGTEGAIGAPMISPDGSRVVFVAGGELRMADLESGAVGTLGPLNLPNGGAWTDDGLIFVADDDGRFLRWFDPDTGPVRDVEVSYCLYPSLLDEGREVLCGGGARKWAFSRELSNPREDYFWRRAAGTRTPGAAVLGSHFRVVDDDYLVHISIDGSIMAAPIVDRDTRTVGRSVSLLPGVRRETYTGAGQYDIAADGTLVYGPGLNAEQGRFVRRAPDGSVEVLGVDEAVHLRYRESPDGRRFATVVEGVQNNELRVYDLRTGAFETVEEAFWIGAPVWSPDGGSLAYVIAGEDSFSDDRVYLKRLDSPDPAREIVAIPEGRIGLQVSSFLSPDSLLVGAGAPGESAFLVNPSTDPVQVDTVPVNAFFLSLSPDRRWLAWQSPGAPGVQLQSWPSLDRRYTVSQQAAEPQWLANGDLVFYETLPPGEAGEGFPFYRVPVDVSREPPVGEPELLFRDPRFADTPGWSFAPDAEGGLIYLQGPAENLVHYVRVIPGWVDRMKAAVDEANR
ncbi:MAG: protein kinase [Gemmatimonadales bacterium]|jgi:serine/threonine-protein kinase|nr:MAG: protein kinase [Gemmatimonadales bacterium]